MRQRSGPVALLAALLLTVGACQTGGEAPINASATTAATKASATVPENGAAAGKLPFQPTKRGMELSAAAVSISVPDEALHYNGPGCLTWYKRDGIYRYGKMGTGEVQHLFGNLNKIAYCLGGGIKLYIEPDQVSLYKPYLRS